MLRLENITKRFGGLTVLNNISFDLGTSGITALIGPNGSGKTTLARSITGLCQPDRGKIVFDGQEIQGLPPYRISRKGLVGTFQQPELFPHLSTLDNLLAAAPRQTGEMISSLFFYPGQIDREERNNREEAEEILEMLSLKTQRDVMAGRLNFCKRKLLEIGRTLMAHPLLVLLDEPTAGVDPSLIGQLSLLIKEQRKKGIRFLLIEHNLSFVAALSERLMVMASGNLVFCGTPAEARSDKRVREVYSARSIDNA